MGAPYYEPKRPWTFQMALQQHYVADAAENADT
jgi:hypothetical protein